MRCGILYFSATGNTDYVARLFKKELLKYNITSELIEIDKTPKFKDDFDMFVLGAPIYCDAYPDYFVDYILKHLRLGKGRKVMLFSTRTGTEGAGPRLLGEKLKKIGFKIYGEFGFNMPNNYYLTMFPKTPEEQAVNCIREASKRVPTIVMDFNDGRRSFDSIKSINIIIAKLAYPIYKSYSYSWARKKLNIDDKLCTRCNKCVVNCPTHNIKMLNNNISFNKSCISCQRCLHRCPNNAFMYKNKHFQQYKPDLKISER
jgi:ferredoxin/flavodoxin